MRLREEGAADANFFSVDLLYVSATQTDLHGRQNRDVQHGREDAGQIFGAIEEQCHAAVAHVQDARGYLAIIADDSVRTRAHQRNALPLAALASASCRNTGEDRGSGGSDWQSGCR